MGRSQNHLYFLSVTTLSEGPVFVIFSRQYLFSVMSQRLVGYIQVFLQHQQLYDALASPILKLRYKFVRVLYDALGLVRVRYVVVELFCQV